MLTQRTDTHLKPGMQADQLPTDVPSRLDELVIKMFVSVFDQRAWDGTAKLASFAEMQSAGWLHVTKPTRWHAFQAGMSGK
jgi:hypothetical protein